MMMIKSEKAAAVLLVAGFSIVMLAHKSHDDGNVRRQNARMDSMATTLEQVTRRLNGGPSAPTVGAVSTKDAKAEAGSPTARITIVAFEDYRCPFCAKFYKETFPILQAKFIAPGLVRFVVMDLPLPNHPYALEAAVAARCVARDYPNLFWSYHAALYQNQQRLSDSVVTDVAAAAGIHDRRFLDCRKDAAAVNAVRRSAREAESAHLAATPAFIVGRSEGIGMIRGRVITGAVPTREFEEAIAAAQDSSNNSNPR